MLSNYFSLTLAAATIAYTTTASKLSSTAAEDHEDHIWHEGYD
jgi:hypothetical protein